MQKLLLVYYHSENRATSPNLETTSTYDFFPRFGGGGGWGMAAVWASACKLSWTLFARPGSALTRGRKKGEFRYWTNRRPVSRGFIFARRRLCLNIYRSAASLTCFASKNRKTELCRKQNMAERRLVPFANVIRDVTQRFSPTWEGSVAWRP